MVETPETAEEKPPLKSKRRRWRPHRAAGAGLSLLLLALICGLGLLVAVLAMGKLNLDTLKPFLTSTLQNRLGPAYRLEIGGLALERRDQGLALALDGFNVSRADGHRILSAPKAELIFDPLSLLTLSFRPERVELEDLRVELLIRPDGGLDLNAGDEAPAGAPRETPAAADSSASAPAPDQSSVAPPTSAPTPAPRGKILRQAGGAINSIFDFASGGDSPIAALDHFGIRRGRLLFVDLAAGQKRTFDNFEFSLGRKRVAGRGVAQIAISARGPSGKWSVKGFARGARGEPHDLSVEASGFSIDEIALLAGKTALPIDSDIPLSVKAEASFAAGGHVIAANARLGLSEGFWRFDDPDFPPVFIDEVFAAAHWDGANHRVLIEQAQIFSGATRFFLNGSITPPASDAAPWNIAFKQTEPGIIGPDRAGEKSVAISTFQGALSLDLSNKILEIGRIEMTGPEVSAAFQGTVDWVNGPHLRLGIAAGRMTAAGLLAIWPNAAGAPVRGWAGDHLLGGTLESARMAIDLDEIDLRMMRAQHPPMDDRIAIDYTFKDASFTFVDDAPPVTGLNGQGHSSGRAARVTGSVAAIEAAPGHRIELSDGVLSMPDFATRPPALSVTARARGGLEALGELLAKPAFAKVASLPLDPKTTRGQFDAVFTYRTKLTPVFDPSLAAIDVSGKVENFSAERLVGKEKLDQATLAVSLEGGVTRVTGTGKLFGAPATLELNRKGSEPAQGAIAFNLDEAGRAKAGFSFGATVAGPVAVKIVAEVGAARPQAQVELDMTKTGLNYPVPGLYKPAGRAAKATFAFREDERGGANLDQIVFDGSGPSARGAMQFSADGALVSAKFPQIRFSPGDSLEIDTTRSGDMLKVVARGAAIDARPFLKNLSASNGGGDAADFDLSLNATLMSGANRQIVSNADLRAVRKGGQYQTLNFKGKLGGDALQAAIGAADGGPPLLRVSTSDAGALLGFLDLYSHMEGGRLTGAFKLSDGGLSGSLEILQFVLRGEPALRSFVSSPNAEPITAKVKIDPNAMAFSRLYALLDKRNGRLTIQDGTISSPSIGSTLEGWVDFDRDALDLTGVFVPAYGVNNLFGQLPVIGILVGGSQEGLIGLNYRVSGKFTSPSLTVNPLSAIAPGFLRKIFGVLPP
ncbi:AsmA-like C-terminal region-containing protein [uncultured Rhodoblastus sp.]|uniref:YhdP family protein n=1 Tax=uncultured Rhodoblastus sp. TaxID=543037 RepID=UPI0025EA49B0|nr:AsmA-like C-terminal region-containing protein [uncultured Rhodoblastus sp.]